MHLVGERKACAALVLAFFGLLFCLNGFLGPPAFRALFYALGATYGAAYFGLVSGWFWARWYAVGLSLSGVVEAALLAWNVGLEPIVLFWGGSHLLVWLALFGKGPVAAFDGRKEWRDRFRMDESSANRLGKAITRAGASLPYLIMAGLAPKPGSGAIVALALGVAGLCGVVRLRTWGVFALAGGAACSLLVTAETADTTAVLPWLAAAGLLAAVAPFARPIARAIRSA